MSASAEAASPPVVRRDQSMAARRAARRKKAEREMRIVRLLDAGVSMSDLAEQEGLTQRRMRAVVQEILEKRVPPPPAEFLALQVGRLNEALNVSYGAMSGANLRAVDRVVRIVRELDRYHGFDPREPAGRPEEKCLADAPQAALAFQAPVVGSAVTPKPG